MMHKAVNSNENANPQAGVFVVGAGFGVIVAQGSRSRHT
jgi:hypothetical protein